MQLTKLEIKGFKSFGDQITINFDEGVTAIVGPNGCGKSNVVDAIRWVLGEQSTRMLRSEKMENIIFNGSKTRKPANLAEVSLTFDNTKNILPTDFSQVTLTRKLYRSGESEYRLNDVQCRLKDITDLFLDTGIGSDSYAIIELKMIDEIINNKENSRRALFEEASGISKYKLRKKQTFSKLKDTEADLERVEDLLFEIEKNLRTLENQAKKTERYYKLKEQCKALSISLASFRIAAFSSSLAGIEEQEQKQKEEKTTILTQIDTLEAELQKQKLDNLTRERNLATQQKATNEYIAKIRAYESEKKIKNEQLKNQEDKDRRLTTELERDRDQLNHVLYNIKRLGEEKKQEEIGLEELKKNTEALKTATDDLRTVHAAKRNELNALTTAASQTQNQLYQAEKDIEILRIQRQALEAESLRNMDEVTDKEAQLTYFNTTLTELEQRVGREELELNALTTAENNLQQLLTETNQELADVKEQTAAESRRFDAKQNEFNLTKSLVDNLEGFPESIRFLKKNSNWAKNAPLLSDVLFCREEYRIAIENYLEPVMNHYVVHDYSEAVSAIKLLGDAARGRAQFFILDNFKDINQDAPAPSNGLPALQIVEVEPRYQPLCNHLLQNVYLIDDTIDAENDRRQLPPEVVLLAKNGRFNKSKLTMAGGSVGLFEGKRIGRAKNLENLLKEIRQLEQHLGELKYRAENLQSASTALKSQGQAGLMKDKQQALQRLNTELITIKTRQEQHQAFIENSRNRKEDIAGKITAIAGEIFVLQPQVITLKEEQNSQALVLQEKQEVFNQLSDDLTASSNEYNQQNIRFHQHQNKVAGLQKDLEYREHQQQGLTSRITEYDNGLEKVKAAIHEILKLAGHSDDDLLEMYGQKEKLEKAALQAEQDYYSWKSQITDRENEISGCRRKKDQAEVLENELREQRSNLRVDLNALKERLSVEFNIDINDLFTAESPVGENEQELRDRTDKLKKQLDDFGAINPMAVEAYIEMNERYTFIQSQKKDLLEAKTSLLATIKEIDDTAREKFMSAFMNVRENFINVFRSLFNAEDSCDLLLTDPDNPLDSDIDIIARPKGKRPLSINQLSGGEKTLTATAILFSLYLLKPAPFCIFDEVDAPLDDTNIDKFNNIIREFSGQSQFIVVSHNKRTIASTDVIYGVTMVEQGISRVVPVDMRELSLN